jgi:hypothetical protein
MMFGKLSSWLFLFFALSFLACEGEEAALKRQLLGEWYHKGRESAGYRFNSDGTYRAWDGDRKQEGIWDLKGKTVVCRYDDEELWRKVDLLGDTLLWDKTYLVRAESSPVIDRALLGDWVGMVNRQEEIFSFFQDGNFAYYSRKGTRPVEGHWHVRSGRIVLDGDFSGSEAYAIRGENLSWGRDRYTKAPDSYFLDYLPQQLPGQWYTNDIGTGVRYTFQKNGAFSSHDGRFESKGKWNLQGDRLVLDGFTEGAERLRIRGNRMQWGKAIYHRLNATKAGRWQFLKKGKEIIAEDKLNETQRILVTDQKNRERKTTYQILSSVGQFVCLGKYSEERIPAELSYKQFIAYNAETGEQVLLSDIFSQKIILNALLDDEVLLSKLPSQQKPGSLRQLVDLVKGDCEMSMGMNLITSFSFHHLKDEEVGLRIGLPNTCRGRQEEMTELGIYLPIPKEYSFEFKYANAHQELMEDRKISF